MTKYTPGPWQVELPLEDQMNEGPIITAHGGKTLVAEVLGPLSDEDGPARGNFDAPLIAAAPDLLAACQRVWMLLPFDSPERKVVIAALAKATPNQ